MSAAEDRLALEDLLTAYCAAIDRREDAAGAAWFFAEDGVLDNTALGSPLATGRAALIETISGMFGAMARLEHYLSNFLITASGKNAVQAQCYVQAHGQPNAGEAFAMRGIYSIEARREADGWKLARLAFRPFG